MAEIIPAVIGQNFTEVENKIRLIQGAAERVHLDIMDGTFTKQSGWRTPDDLQFFEGRIKIEVHLMIREPEASVRAWAEVADRILVHAEAIRRGGLDEIIKLDRVGLAFNLNTSLSAFESKVDQVNLVQLMAIDEIGEQGHPFDERVFEKIKLLRRDCPSVKIQIDGGVSLDNARDLIAAGADNLVVGSAIWQTPDPLVALKLFQSLIPTS